MPVSVVLSIEMGRRGMDKGKDGRSEVANGLQHLVPVDVVEYTLEV